MKETTEQFGYFQDKEVDMSPYLNKGFHIDQLYEIYEGLRFGVDVSVYADLKYDDRQMREIWVGMVGKLDVNSYADPSLSWKQMQERRFALGEEKATQRHQKEDPFFQLILTMAQRTQTKEKKQELELER